VEALFAILLSQGERAFISVPVSIRLLSKKGEGDWSIEDYLQQDISRRETRAIPAATREWCCQTAST
jgi:hypothetical protein